MLPIETRPIYSQAIYRISVHVVNRTIYRFQIQSPIIRHQLHRAVKLAENQSRLIHMEASLISHCTFKGYMQIEFSSQAKSIVFVNIFKPHKRENSL